MLTLTRGFARLDAALRRGVWESQWAVGSSPPAPWPELAGKTLGILGYGRIGQALARRARAFDMEVCAIRREATRSHSETLAFLGGPDALGEVVRRADYLAVTLSLTEATRGILGERELRMMKPTAVLINVARAERRPFHELAQVLMTPHVSGWTEGMLEARAKLIAESIQRTARGESPLNLIR